MRKIETYGVEGTLLTPPILHRDHGSGHADAPITLVEFGDYQCYHCQIAHFEVKHLQKILDKKIRFIFRNFPLTHKHEFALLAAEAAEAAGLQQKFWPMHNVLYENQKMLGPRAIFEWAEELDLSLEKFGKDIDQGHVMRRIKEDRQSGLQSGVNSTQWDISKALS